MKSVAEALMAAVPVDQLPLVEAVRDAAAARGIALFVVGGPVRDLLLERPLRDVDLLIGLEDPLQLPALLEAAAPRGARFQFHERFGTAQLERGDAVIDLTTPRSESYAKAGALPRVEPSSLAEDLARRDFSVNAIACPLVPKGPLIDPHEGVADLAARQLRVLHPQSFHDDPTRAFRAARLAARLDFHLARRTRSALTAALRDGAFGGVSGDRFRREIEKAFEEARDGHGPAETLRLLAQWHVLPALEPGLTLPRESLAPLRRLARSLADPPWRGPRARAWAAGLAVWLAPLPAALRRRTVARLSIRGELAARLRSFPQDRDRWLRGIEKTRGRGAVDALLAGIDEERLLALHAWASPSVRRRIVRWAAEDRGRRLPVTGTDLTAAGLDGPRVGAALARIRAAYLDGEVANREEALALAREVGRGSRPRRRAPR